MRPGSVLLIIIMLLSGCGEQVVRPEQDDMDTPDAVLETVPKEPNLAVPVSDGAFTIVVLGDSLTAGFGLAREDALPEQMGALFAASGRDNVTMVNAGVSGDTTAGGLARYDWSVASANPDLLIVALGANDFLGGVAATDARGNLAQIIERAQAGNVSVILANVEAGDIATRDPRIAAYAAIYPDLAETYDVPLFKGILGGVRGQTGLIQSDGLHPTRQGVAIMAERLAGFVAAYLPEQASDAE